MRSFLACIILIVFLFSCLMIFYRFRNPEFIETRLFIDMIKGKIFI